MKEGDLVRLDITYFPEYRGYVGVLVQPSIVINSVSDKHWQVMISGKIHPFSVSEGHMEIVS